MQNALELIAEAVQALVAEAKKAARALEGLADLHEQQLEVLKEIRLTQDKMLHRRRDHDQEG